MIVLLTGATGFIGSHLTEALAAKHQVICASRTPLTSECRSLRFRHIHADFTKDFDPADWLPRLQGVDIVINAVGILRERGAQTFDALHIKTPLALFAACAKANVKLVVQISALGADEHASTDYHRSKQVADDFLLGLSVPSVVIQPSLAYGQNGASARLFSALASLPIIPLPGKGDQRVQPIHIDDLTAAVTALLEKDIYRRQRMQLVGAESLSFRDFLAELRHAMGLPPPRFLPISPALVQTAATLGGAFSDSLLDQETLQMLERGAVADAAPTRHLLGRNPTPIKDFIKPTEAPAMRTQAKLYWLLPLLRFSIAMLWIVTGVLSLGVYPVAESYALLAKVGVAGAMAPPVLYGAALLDIALGVAILACSRRRLLWLAQIAVIAGYTAIITWKLPEFWLHPYGPILKNLPILAAIWLLYELDND